jgi:hypothetical protein
MFPAGNVSEGDGRQSPVSITRHLTQKNMTKATDWRATVYVIADADILVPDIAAAYRSRMKVADLSSYEEVRIFNEIKKEIAARALYSKTTFPSSI